MVDWQPSGNWTDIRYETAEGIAKITIDRPEVRNAFRPETLIEISDARERAREDTSIGVIVLRYKEPDRHRPFRVPGAPFTPLISIAAAA